VGFTVPALLPGPRCALAAPFRPYPSEAGRSSFCGTVPDAPSPRLWRIAGRYPAPWFHGARTFLVGASSTAAARPSGEAAYRRVFQTLRVSVVRAALGAMRILLVNGRRRFRTSLPCH